MLVDFNHSEIFTVSEESVTEDAEDKIGFIVSEDGCHSMMGYDGAEKWFENSDDAVLYAIECVKENYRLFPVRSVRIYKSAESFKSKSHSIPNKEGCLFYEDQHTYAGL